MRIHGICLVKNEADIIEWSLEEAARWCDQIYVFDNGSTDGSWEMVESMAHRLPSIVPFRQDPQPFDNALRGIVFNEYRNAARTGDWWCRLDADEIYVEDPKSFLKSTPTAFHVVWATHLQYYLTAADLDRFSPEDFELPPRINASNAPRFYQANASEARFFRHRPGLVWNHGAWPHHVGLVYPRRIHVRHYQHRSPAQIQRRLDTRHAAINAGNVDFPHIVEKSWRETLSHEALAFDAQDGRFVSDDQRLPRHLEPTSRRLLKRVMHGTGLWP
jgi:glycosyltransferase involved in cell wall biosynthesis